MKLISHRGNFEGKEHSNENHPYYIKRAIEHGFEVEIDVWFEKGWWLGHDSPKYPIDLEIKYVWTPKKNIPTTPLIRLINFAPWYPDETLKKTGKGIPCFWEGFPII